MKPWRRWSWRASMPTTWSFPPKTPRAPIWDYLEAGLAGRGRGRRAHGESAGYGRLFGTRGIRRADRPHGRRRWATRAIVSVHCHDDLGLAVANSLAAVQAGARQIECTINGIGERAGNAALEEIVMAFKTRRDRLPFETKIVTEHLYPASQLLTLDHHLRAATEQGHRRRERLRARSRHPSGRLSEGAHHLRDHRAASRWACPRRKLVLGKHSGRHALAKRCEDLGFQLTREQLDTLYHRFTALADRKKGVRNDEIVGAGARSGRRKRRQRRPASRRS